jgi:ferredoxin
MATNASLFQVFLDQHDDAAWGQVIASLRPAIHPADQVATRIWFAFFPLKLRRALALSPDPARAARELLLSGKYRLADQIDSSAHFLYGHRYWPEVKSAVSAYAASATAPASLALGEQILEVACRSAERLKVDPALLVGITAVAFMTLQQVGWEAFQQTTAAAAATKRMRSPEQILRERARDDRQGLFGFLRTVDQVFTVTFDERDPGATFKVINMQDLATAAAKDRRDYRSRDPRCIEGPIPVECRTAACGTCWVGILSDPSKLSPPGEREVNKMKDFGYAGFSPEQHSIIRLACQTKCYGNVSIVIPPWNGVIGKLSNAQVSDEVTSNR